MKQHFIFVFVLPLLLLSCGRTGETLYPADTPEVRYTGRTLTETGGTVSFDWSGTYLTTSFSGGRISAKCSDTGESYYNIFIDGELEKVIHINSADTLIELASRSDNKIHLLRMQKRSEGEFGRTSVHGFVLNAGGELHYPAGGSGRHIEFIGNSLTCGFGVESAHRDDPFLVSTENCDLAFGCIIARHFDADYTLIAHSGRGAARNYGDKSPVSEVTMRERMMRTFDEYPEPEWSFDSYTPDLVVINLGSNDFSTMPHPGREQFTEAYLKIISQIRAGYGPGVPILCVSPRAEEPVLEYISGICRTSGDPNIYFGGSMNGVYNDSSDLGAAYHPNYSGQRKMAFMLIPHISNITGWDVSEVVR